MGSWGEAFSLSNSPHVPQGCALFVPSLLPALSFDMFPASVRNFDSMLNKTTPGGLSRGKGTGHFLKENMSDLGDQSHYRVPPLVQETARPLH